MFETAAQRWKLLSVVNCLITYLAHSKAKCGLFRRMISSYDSSIHIVRICAQSGPHVARARTQALRPWRHRKREAAFAASRFLWRRRICSFMGMCHCTGLKELKCAIVYFQGRIFNPTNLLNHERLLLNWSWKREQSNTNNYSVV